MPALFQALNYSVVSAYSKKETLYLLKDVTGYFKPRQMTALVRLKHVKKKCYTVLKQLGRWSPPNCLFNL